MSTGRTAYDVTVVGGGHNGLTAAAYLARAGLSVLVLERLPHLGGAAVTAVPFAGHAARVSRYAATVSALPDRLLTDLELDLRLTPRPVADPLGPDHPDRASWDSFQAEVGRLAAAIAPTLLEPLPTERTIRERTEEQTWTDLVARPLGEAIERRFTDDTVRAAVALDAATGAFASMHDTSLTQNRTFLYRRLGNGTDNGTGPRVPVGGMGAVSGALAQAATRAGAEILTSAGVSAIRGDADGAEVTWHDGQRVHTVPSRHVLAGVAPWVLRILLGDGEDDETKPHGAQLRISLLVDRLPRLRSGRDPREVLAGALRVGGGYEQLEAAYAEAAAGRVPTPLPGELTCPSLTDPSLVADVPDGMHVLSFHGAHTPAALFDHDRDGRAEEVVASALAAVDEHLAEPLTSVVATDAEGRPCLEVKVPQDVEAELAMPGGHPHHGDLDWPWAPNRARLDTPAQQWGVQTDLPSVLVCGSGARRGGTVSGLGGHNAAQAVLASR